LRAALTGAAALVVLLASGFALAHGVADRDAAYLEQHSGLALSVFAYLGAKHMVTGYDHLLYLLAVIFFLYRMRDVALYVTMFAVGHSITLLTGVLGGIDVDPYLVDGIIGLSIVYKAFENLGGFRKVFGVEPNQKLAVFAFGLIHGFGLSTKLQEFALSGDGLVANILAFNVGVEIGQLLALAILIFIVAALRATRHFVRYASAFNVLLMFAGFLLAGYQFAGLALAPV
jgi:hypothetical protein